MGVDTRFDIDALADIQQRLVGTEKSIDTAVGRQDIEGRTRSGKVHIFKLGQHGRYDHRSRLKTLRSSSFCRGRFYSLQTYSWVLTEGIIGKPRAFWLFQKGH